MRVYFSEPGSWSSLCLFDSEGSQGSVAQGVLSADKDYCFPQPVVEYMDSMRVDAWHSSCFSITLLLIIPVWICHLCSRPICFQHWHMGKKRWLNFTDRINRNRKGKNAFKQWKIEISNFELNRFPLWKKKKATHMPDIKTRGYLWQPRVTQSLRLLYQVLHNAPKGPPHHLLV